MNGMNGGVPGGKPGEIVNPGSIPAAPESFADKLLRFLKGMIGLDSGVPQPVNSGSEQGLPSKEGPSKPIIQPAPPILKGG